MKNDWNCIPMYMMKFKSYFRKYLRRYPGFDPITFSFSENSNYWQESLLEVIRQNIAGWCEQTFCFHKFADIAQQNFAFLPHVNFPANNLNFHWRWRWWDQIQAIFLNLFYFTIPRFEIAFCKIYYVHISFFTVPLLMMNTWKASFKISTWM